MIYNTGIYYGIKLDSEVDVARWPRCDATHHISILWLCVIYHFECIRYMPLFINTRIYLIVHVVFVGQFGHSLANSNHFQERRDAIMHIMAKVGELQLVFKEAICYFVA